jgi:hypothetical protein
VILKTQAFETTEKLHTQGRSCWGGGGATGAAAGAADSKGQQIGRQNAYIILHKTNLAALSKF